jgi:hypothetical protein
MAIFVTIRRRWPAILTVKGTKGDDAMSDRTSFVTPRKRTIGDVVVDGLLAGLPAGVVMGLFLVVVGLAAGVRPGQTLGRFDPGGNGSPLTGALMHLAVSGLYGVGLALLLHVLGWRWAAWRRFGWLLGVGYGVVVWLVAQWVLLPGLGIAPADLPPGQFIVAHLIYGVVLGYVLRRHQPA